MKEVVKRIFDHTNPNWLQHVEYNEVFIRAQEAYFNNRLHAVGNVFLNEVFDALGFERTQEGAIKGWLASNGDVIHINWKHLREGVLELRFNPSGVIYDKI